jgi:hypothetical protein
MKPANPPQRDLFQHREPMESKISANERSMVRALLGQLLWTVLEPPARSRMRGDDRDE